jgi:predicted membrane-bound mannosyltransferase
LPWYLEKEDATVACARDEMDLQTHQSAQPPVIIARNDSRDAVRRQFPEYYSAKYELRTYGTETVFFFHPDYAQRPERRA